MRHELIIFIHIFGIILEFVGIIGFLFWKIIADYSKNLSYIRILHKNYVISESIFVVGGGTIIFLSGLALTIKYPTPFLETRWLIMALIYLALAASVWAAAIIPIMIKLNKILAKIPSDGLLSEEYWRISRLFYFFRCIEFSFLIIVLYSMVIK